MKLTLLRIVQRALSAIDSQNVSDVSDNPESLQVVHIVNRVYEELLAKRDWPFLRVSDINLVTTLDCDAWELAFPSNMMNLEYMKYNKKEVVYISPERFVDMLHSRDTTDSNVNSIGVITDKDPQYWTTIDETKMMFDSYDSSGTLMPSLCHIQYMKEVTSELSSNSEIAILPARFHSVLMDGVLATVFDELAQDTNKAQRKDIAYRKGLARMNRWARKIEEALPNYQNKYNFGRNAWRWNRPILSPRVR